SGGGRCVKEKNSNVSNIEVVKDGVVTYVTSDYGNVAKEVVSPFMVDETMLKEKQCSLSSYARVMIKLRAEVELKDNIVMAMPRIKGEGHFIFNVCVEYAWKPPRKLMFVDDDENPLVPTSITESDSEVEVVYDETANLRLSKSGKDSCEKGYGTNSLLEQWRDSYLDNDDYDPYDDDMYNNYDMSEHLQSICDDLDITIHGRKKK
ncbi:hypothetical protein Tco_1396153, partial [Tanacetum coccineum]